MYYKNTILILLLGISATNCNLFLPKQEVVRQVNGSYSDDNSAVLLVESRYKTSNPLNPYYYDPEASDFEVVLYQSSTNLKDSVEILRFKEEVVNPDGTVSSMSSGGGIQYNPIYWLKARKRLIGMNFIDNGAYILDLDTGIKHFLSYSPDAFAKLLPNQYLFLSNQFDPYSIVPSPDSTTVGVIFLSGYLIGQFTINSIYILSFFDTASSKIITSKYIPASNPERTIFMPSFSNIALNYQAVLKQKRIIY